MEVEDSVFLAGAGRGIERVTVNGQAAPPFVDPAREVVHGRVAFAAQPVTIEAAFDEDRRPSLPA
jgi:hypothetical protein